MNLRNTEYFIAIADSGSLTKAAELLYISQPSLSQYLKRLERSLGVELFDHKTSPLKLTYSGERYYAYVKQIQQLDENINKELQDIKNQTGGRIRLGVAFWREACLLPDIFPEFHELYPDICLVLTEGTSHQLENWLMNDKLDIAVMNLTQFLNHDRLTCEFIYKERILLAAPSQHPYVKSLLQDCRVLGGYPVAPLELLNQMPFIPTKPNQNLTRQVMYALNQNRIEPNIPLDTGNLTTAINLTAMGMGCTFVPEEGAKVCQQPGKITYFTVDSPDFMWDFLVVYKKGAYLSQLSRLFIDYLKNHFIPKTEL